MTLENAEDGADFVYTHDFAGAITSVGGSAERLTGYSEAEMRAMCLGDLLEPEFVSLALQDVVEQMGGGSPASRRIRLRGKSGKSISLDMISRLIFEKGRPIAVKGLGWEPKSQQGKPRHKVGSPARGDRSQATDFKDIHILNVRTYDSVKQVFDEFLRTGCEIFHLPTGLVHRVNGKTHEVLAARGLPPGFSMDPDSLVSSTDIGGYLGGTVLVEGAPYARLSFLSLNGGTRRFTREEHEWVELMGRGLGRQILEQQSKAEGVRAARLEADRNTLLGMVSGKQPLAQIQSHVIKMLERHSPSARAAVILFENGRVSRVTAPGMPRIYHRIVRRIPLDAPVFRSSPFLDGTFPVEQLAKVLRGHLHPAVPELLGLSAITSAPVLSGAGHLLGVLVLHHPEGVAPRPEEHGVLSSAGRLVAMGIETHELAKRLEHDKHHDPLTGLPNRERFTGMLEDIVARARRHDQAAAVLYLDLDRFGKINEVYGHSAGDELLKLVGERLKKTIGREDAVARLAADEFAVALAGLSNGEAALLKPAAFIETMRLPFLLADGQEVFATASIGVSIFPRDADTASALLRRGEHAMHAAKQQGRNDWKHAGTEQEPPAPELEIIDALRRALENGELKLHYQPILTMDEVLAGLEALLVWNHPKRGRISPAVFIPLAEEAGLIQQIGTWVLEEVCRQNAVWQSAGYAPILVAANVSALQFGRPEFFDAVRSAIDKTGLNPEWLELELTETVVSRDIEESAKSIRKLREIGVRISIDDFGMGGSTLNALSQLPLDTLKIDRSFVRDLASADASLPLVQAIVTLGHNLKLQVIAEGVETREQMEILKSTGCDKMQGHLYGTAAAPELIEPILALSDRTMKQLTV